MESALDDYLNGIPFEDIVAPEILFDEPAGNIESSYIFGEPVTRENFAAMVIKGQFSALGTCAPLAIYFSTLFECGALDPEAIHDFIQDDTQLSEPEVKLFIKAFEKVSRFHKNTVPDNLIGRIKNTIAHCLEDDNHSQNMQELAKYLEISPRKLVETLQTATSRHRILEVIQAVGRSERALENAAAKD